MFSQKSALAIALLGMTTFAAASEVTVYGMADAYVQLYNGGNGTVATLGSGGKGGSRIGIKGTENLGNGTDVFFRLENGFFLDNGTNTTAAQPNGWAFQREAVLGIKNANWGSFSFGRQYTLNFGGVAMFDAFACSLGSMVNNFMAPAPYVPGTHIPGINGASGVDNLTRRDNSFLYETPSLGGLKLSAMVSLGEQKKLASEEQSNKLGNSYAAQAVYRHGNLAAGFTYTYQNLAAETPNMFKSPNAHASLYNFGASYDLGFTKLYGNFIYKNGSKAAVRDTNPNLAVYGLSAKTPLFGGFLLSGFAYLRNNTTDHANAWNVSSRFDYPLSKRTTVYVGAAYLDNDANVNYTINGGGGTSSAPATNMGKNPWTTFVGMNHTF